MVLAVAISRTDYMAELSKRHKCKNGGQRIIGGRHYYGYLAERLMHH